MAAPEADVWHPPARNFEASNLARLMRKMGFEPHEYGKFHEATVRDPAAYLQAALADLQFPWATPPELVLNGWKRGEPIHQARWYHGARVNVFDVGVSANLRAGRGSQPAVIWEDEAGSTRTWTFEQLDREAQRASRALAAFGVRPGDVVAVLVPTRLEAVALFYGLLRIGGVFCPIATDMAAEQVAVRLNQSGARVLVTADGFLARGKTRPLKPTADSACRAAPGVRHVVVVRNAGPPPAMTAGRDLWWDDWMSAAERMPAAPTQGSGPDDLTMILFSSGTTGTPKGTRHTFAAYIEDMMENAYASDLRAGDRSFWLTNVGWMMFPWLLSGHGLGATVVLYEGAFDHPEPDRLLRFAARHQVTHLGLSPDPLRVIVDAVEADAAGVARYKLGSLRELRNTGAPLTGQLFARAGKVLGLWPSGAWGGTDGCFCLGGGNPVFPRDAASIVAAPGMDVHVMKLDDKTGQLRDTRGDEVGEVVVQTPFPSMTRGLLHDEDGRRFRAAYFEPKLAVPAEAVEAQGLRRWWFHGDLARRRSDGSLWILGRADDLLVVRGTNIDPTSVSEAIGDLVQSSAPVVCMDGDSSELFVFVVRRPDDATPPADLEAAVQGRIRERVNKRTAPKRVFEVSGIPMTINSKPQLRLVRAAFLGEPLGDTSTLRNPHVLDEIRAHGKAHFGR